MGQAHLLIKYKDSLICEKVNNRVDFINVPPYSNASDFTNISVFITLLLNGLMDQNFNALVSFNYAEWEEKFEVFNPDFLYLLDGKTYIYDLDKEIIENELSEKVINKNLTKIPSSLVCRKISELHDLSLASKDETNDENFLEDKPYTYFFSIDNEYLGLELEEWISVLDIKRSDKDVLVLYSGGKDSTLTAIRLHNAGYKVHFIHFDNGCMRDVDKPFLTYLKTFKADDGYYFSYDNKALDVSHLVRNYQSRYTFSDLPNLELDSEYACLSCRMAMYTEAIRYAKNNGFKYIAEGARKSQKFMLEQPEFLSHLQTLASSYGIQLLFPVLEIINDQDEIKEIIQNGYSSKTWESKCLIGKPSIDKSDDDKRGLIEYFEDRLKPTMKKVIEYK